MIQPEEQTLREVTEIFFPDNKFAKLSRSAVEFLMDQRGNADTGTLKRFVEFLIKNKGYN